MVNVDIVAKSFETDLCPEDTIVALNRDGATHLSEKSRLLASQRDSCILGRVMLSLDIQCCTPTEASNDTNLPNTLIRLVFDCSQFDGKLIVRKYASL